MSRTREQYAKFLLPLVAKGTEPITVVAGRGRTVIDDQGREYLDAFSGISVVNAGHNHPKIMAAAREQMEKLVHCCSYVYQVPVVGELAERLAKILPGGLTRSFFGNSGAEANEGALRLAKQATGRHEIVALGYSFHGRTLGTLSVTGNRSRKLRNGPYMSGVAFAPAPYCYRCPLGLKYPSCDVACAESVREVLRTQTSGDVAALIAEPLLGEGGMLVPPPEYFGRVSQILDDEGVLLIVDEVQTGFGRTGRMFAIEHSRGVEPDIVTMAKGIANGFPLGAFATRDGLAESMRENDHLSTFGGNPISCAAALANLAVLAEENLVENARVRGAELMARFAKLPVGEVRGHGLMIGLEIVAPDKTPLPARAKTIRAALRERGVLVGTGGAFGNVVRIQPPLSITASECDRLASAVEACLV
jgi:4-aminobutyrate aminotransferase-like enzyme